MAVRSRLGNPSATNALDDAPPLSVNRNVFPGAFHIASAVTVDPENVHNPVSEKYVKDCATKAQSIGNVVGPE
jgi:hypothetical protein